MLSYHLGTSFFKSRKEERIFHCFPHDPTENVLGQVVCQAPECSILRDDLSQNGPSLLC